MAAEASRTPQVQEMMRRARSAWWEDGITEIVSGLGLLILGFLGFQKEMLPAPRNMGWQLAWTVWLGVFIVGGNLLIRRLKARYVWPVAGYATPRQDRDWRWAGAFFLTLILLVVVAAWNPPHFGAAIAGLPLFIFLLALYRYTRLRRFLVIGTLALVEGLVLALFPLNATAALHLILGTIGLFFCFSGLWNWLRFRRRLQEAPHG